MSYQETPAEAQSQESTTDLRTFSSGPVSYVDLKPPSEPLDVVELEDQSAASKAELRAWLRDLVETLLLAAIIFLIVNTLTGRYEVQSISMEPTLYEGQYLIVSKVSYWFHLPERGDIVVLDPPLERSGPNGDIPYIKRVVGLPGEHVEIRDGRVWINGVLLNEPYITVPPNYQKAQILEENQYMVLGDNRNNSSDSHIWGPVPRENIIGKSVFRYWPLDKWGLIPHYSFPELEVAAQ